MPIAVVNSTNLYERLGVNREATLEEIKKAYRTLLRQYTPERAPEEFKRIREAYETLGSASTRQEYDRSTRSGPDSVLAKANAAMQASDYAAAELLLKQVLLAHPDLAGARNLLGLCLLYQSKANDAITQFTRLLREPNADATVFANAGHAFALAKRYPDAEAAFKEAIARAGDGAGEYYSAWADLWVERNDYKKASGILEEGIRADKQVNFDDVPLLLKLLEVKLLQHDDSGISKALQSLIDVSTEADEKRYTAAKLGRLCMQLVRYDAFDPAQRVARVAERLQPDDVDYNALHDISSALGRNDHDGALRIVRSHVSFASGGWLEQLKSAVLGYCKQKAVFNGMERISSPPSLRTINTVGTALYGRRDYDEATNSYVATLYFVIAFIPVLPLANYRVVDGNPGWHFLGKVRFSHPQKVHLWAVLVGLSLWVLVSVLTARSSVTQTASTFAAPTPAAETPAAPYNAPDPLGLFAPSTVYNGTVTNAGLKDSPASFRVAFDSAADTTTGYATIGRPLGGSGRFLAIVKHDSVYLVSASATGDTIVWGARREGLRLTGDYVLVGGPMSGQHGSWDVRRDSGVALPRH
jgi:curved DNA-binding protein CbpA